MTIPRPAVQPAALRRKVQVWLADDKDSADAIALKARPEWTADPVLTIDNTTVRVVPCRTPLAARAALYDRAGTEKLVLLTELTDAEFGDGLLAHLSHQTVRGVEPWDLVRQMFGGQVGLDSTLVRAGGWLADALSNFAPPEGWPSPPGTVVTREHALRHLTARLLGLPPDQLDSSGLLQWSIDAPAQLRFVGLPEATVDGVTAFLVDVAGPAAVPTMAAVRAGHGVDAIPLGLLSGVLWPRSGRNQDVEVAVARTRLESRFGGARLTATQAEEFQKAAEAWVYRAVDSGNRPEAVRMLLRAEAIAAEVDISDRLGASNLLPNGFVQRMRAFASAVRLAVPAGGVAVPAAVARAQAALATVERHRDPYQRPRVETARMAVRLLRWLAIADGPAPGTLPDALHRQVREDGWVDRARLDIFAGDVEPLVADAYRLLYLAIDVRRARHDRQFAELLAAATAEEAEPGAMLRVEDVLDWVVQPIIDRGRRVLLLVMDGMSTAAATELADSLTRSGAWLEVTPGGGPRTGVLAALPTVTEVSRCSLLSGRISVGDQQAERTAFAKRFPDSVLLHKAALRTGAGAAINPEVSAALDSPEIPLVAAVINTIDDALDRSDPGTVVWGEDTVHAVRDLLAVTRNRVVVVVSDHGHVIDRGSDAVTRPSEGSENRWRPVSALAGDGEVVVSGSRVALGGGKVVLPWREELRYGPRKAGYHGGASPAEAVIPLLVFAADEKMVPGWAGAPVASPDWWREPLPEQEPTAPAGRVPALAGTAGLGPALAGPAGLGPAPAGPARPGGRPKPTKLVSEPGLFELADDVPPAAAAAPRPSLVDALLASDVYAQRRGTRAPLPDERVAALVSALIAGGGRATLDNLAAHAGIPAHRITGTVTALRKLLQVEGYPVITLDPDGSTILLNEDLMVEQFNLAKP